MMRSHRFCPASQKHDAAASAITTDKYEMVSGCILSRTQNRVAASAVRRKIAAIGRREVGRYSGTLELCRTKHALWHVIALAKTSLPVRTRK